MVKIGKISDSVALESFRELDDFLKNKRGEAIKSIAGFIEESFLKDVFEIHQDFVYTQSLGSGYQEILKKSNWFNIIEFIKEFVLSAEKDGFDTSNSEFFSKFINNNNLQYTCVNHRHIDNFLIDFSGKLISYDINKKTLFFNSGFLISENYGTRSSGIDLLDFDLLFQIDDNQQIYTNCIKLFSFEDYPSIKNIFSVTDKNITIDILKYIAEIITAEDLASKILSEIENNLSEIASKWTTFNNEKNPDFYSFPAKFYSRDYIKSKLIDDDGTLRKMISKDVIKYFYKSDPENNTFLREIFDESFNAQSITSKTFFSFLESNLEYAIPGFSELNSDNKKEVIFSKFEEFDPLKYNPYQRIELIEEYFDNDEFFKFIKNTYKFLINKLKSNISIDNKERDCMLVDLNGKVKYVLFTEDIFRFSDYQLSESQLSELKSELIPLLEEVQDKIYLKCYTDKGIPFNLSMSMKEIFDVLDIKNIHIFGSLFKTIDWYPKKIVLVSDFSHPDDFVSAVERFSFIRKLSESKEFDISAILISELEWGYNHGKPMSDNNGTEWVYKRHQQLSGMIKRKISNGYLFSKSCTENFEEKQKFLDVVLSYNTRMPIYKIEVEE